MFRDTGACGTGAAAFAHPAEHGAGDHSRRERRPDRAERAAPPRCAGRATPLPTR